MSGGKVVESGEVFDAFAHPATDAAPIPATGASHTLNSTLPERKVYGNTRPAVAFENFLSAIRRSVVPSEVAIVWRRGQYPAWQD